MPRDDATSLRQRYFAFRENEIEFYKQVIPDRTLMQLAESANQRMQARGDLTLGDLTLAFEVDELIAERLRLPSFREWSRRQCRTKGVRRTWSQRTQQLAFDIPDCAADAPVLLLQPHAADLWEALGAQGRRTLVVEPDDRVRDRVMHDAQRHGWGRFVTVVPALEACASSEQFASVCYSPAACSDLTEWEAEALIESLQQRTVSGGLHLVDGLLRDRGCVSRGLLRRSYSGWRIRARRSEREWSLAATRSTTSILANPTAAD